MSMALPLILSNSGGFPEMVTHGYEGLLFPAGDADALAAEIVSIARDRSLSSQLGFAARQTAIRRFSLKAHAHALEAVYAEAIEIPFRVPGPPTIC
jgi:glycosyltransferase involved in cell wall biosynthesis